MGLVMSFSSLVGFAADIIIPQLAKSLTVKRLIAGSILANLLFSLILLESTWAPLLVFKSLAYIIGPATAGTIFGAFGERTTFMVVGITGALLAATLLAITPRKLKLPQQEIQTWD